MQTQITTLFPHLAHCHAGIRRTLNLCLAAIILGVVFLAGNVSAAVTGTKTALVMLVSLNDAPIDCTVAEVKGFMFTNQPLNVDSYFDHSTWGNVRWAGDVVAVSVNFSKTPCNDSAWSDAADQAALAQGYNPSAYTARIYAFPSSAGNCGYAYASGNRVGNYHCTDLFAYGHEVGHTIGMHHASTDQNNDGIIDAEYGGYDDCMGNESFTHNAPHKIWGGWLPQKAANGGWRQITADGTYQISPLQINPANNPPFSQALKIVPPTGWPYFLSYRQALDFDQGWTAEQVGKDGRSGTSVDPTLSMNSYPYSKGVGIHRHNLGTGVQTLEVAVLADNQEFAIPGTGIVISQTGYDANQVTVNVTGFSGGSMPLGVRFFQHGSYGGAQSQPLTAGDYTLAQLQANGALNDWASSCRIPAGFTVTMYADNNFVGTSWTLTADTPSFSALSPSANDQMSSCRITGSANPVPPATPAGLSATAGDAQINLSWSAIPGATSYNVKRATTSGGPYTTIASPTVSSYVNTGLANGTTYYYVVSAVNASGESANSTQATATPTSELLAHWRFDENSGSTAGDASGNGNTGTLSNGPTWSVPGQVGTSALLFTHTSLQSVTVPNSSSLNNPINGITLAAWINPTTWGANRRILQKGNSDNQYRLLAESGVFKFHLSGVDTVTAALPPTGSWIHVAATWDGTTMIIYYNGVQQTNRPATGQIPATADPLAIAAKFGAGGNGDYFSGRIDDVRIYNRALSASEVTAIMGGGGGTPPAAPTGLNATAGNAQVSLTWNASSGATSYNVKRATTSGGPYATVASPTGTGYTDTGLVNGTTYYYVVSAVNSNGESANSAQASATPLPSAPATPTGLNATAGDAQVSLTWNTSSGATSYNVKRATTSGGPYTTVASPNGTSYTNTGLVNGTTYYYVVSAVNLGGESGNSSQVSATPTLAAPAAPTGLNAVAGNAEVALSWAASSGASSYNVKRATTSGGPYTTVASPTGTSHTDTGLANDTTYYYVVSAVNAGGESANSSQVSATPSNDVLNGLVGFWKFDENSGSTTVDSSGNSNTGTLLNSPAWVTPGRVGVAALSFTAASQQAVSVAHAASLNPTAGITVAAWINAADWSGNRRVLQKGASDNQYRLLAENGSFKAHLAGLTGGTLTTALPAAGSWVHVAATYNGTTLAIYYNGTLQASQSASGNLATTTDTLFLGTKNTSAPAGDYFNGQMDDVRIYNRALSLAEITTVMNIGGTPPPGVPTGLNATAGNTQVSLTWNTGSGATSYNVKRATTSGGPYTTIAAPTGTSYTDAGLVNGTTYYYVVSAVNTGGESGNSAQVSATPTGPVTLLSDGFELNFNNWTDGGTTDWDRNTSQFVSGSFSAHAGSADNDLISDNLNTAGYGSITISFWYRDDDIDDSDDVYLQLYNGSTYVNRLELGNSAEDTWHFVTINLSNSGADAQYFISNFRIKFEGSSIDNGENLWIDDVTVTVQ